MDLPTDRYTGTFIIDTLNYTTSLGPRLVILMINPQLLGGIGEPGKAGLLGNNFPNPFPAATSIPFRLPLQENTELGIYDLDGKLVRLIFSGPLGEGEGGGNRHAKERKEIVIQLERG